MTTNEKTGLLLKSNGEIEEHTIDMTPHTNNIGKLLNDKVSFIGQLLREPERTNAVLMFGKNAQGVKKINVFYHYLLKMIFMVIYLLV